MDGMSATYVLFPVFSGLFGLSGIVFSLGESQFSVPQKPYADVRLDRELIMGGFLGALGGAVVGVLPAMSPSQVGTLMSSVYGCSRRAFLISVSAIASSDAIYSLVSLYTIKNARSGVSVMLGRILTLSYDVLFLFVGVYCLCAFFALLLHLEIGKRAAQFYGFIDYRVLSVSVLLFVVVLVFLLTGLFGILVAAVSCSIGLLPIMSRVSRTHLMGVLLVPTILYFAAHA